MNTPKIVIIPDVHGRKFWKDAVDMFPQSTYPNMQIVFLGDYLDPYTGYEDITKEDAFTNFLEIIDYAKRDSRITLLIGNHDWHYFVYLDTCRIDYARGRQIEQIFKENINMFRLHKVIELNGTKYLFTHAGITQNWLDDIAYMAIQQRNEWNPGDPSSPNYVDTKDDERYQWICKIANINKTYDIELLEKCLEKYDDAFYSCIPSMISRERGGWYPHGSIIWADVHEHLYYNHIDEYYQIFGHTMPYPNNDQYAYEINSNWAMIDASQAFVIDDSNCLKILRNF